MGASCSHERTRQVANPAIQPDMLFNTVEHECLDCLTNGQPTKLYLFANKWNRPNNTDQTNRLNRQTCLHKNLQVHENTIQRHAVGALGLTIAHICTAGWLPAQHRSHIAQATCAECGRSLQVTRQYAMHNTWQNYTITKQEVPIENWHILPRNNQESQHPD